MTVGITLARAEVEIGGNLLPLQRALAQAGTTLERAGKGLRDVGRKLSARITLPLVGIGAVLLKMGGDFEAEMNRVQAVSGATAEEFTALQRRAKELGATTQYTASQVADAMGFLAMAGLRANEILGAIPGTLQLAASAQIDLASSADIVTNVLTGYGLAVSELGRANDVLVKTFTRTNTDLTMLGEAFKYAGPVAKAAGVEFEEAAAVIGLMGNAGIQASMAGTSLRGAIAKLVKPTKESARALKRLGVDAVDSQGQLRPLADIIQQLEESGATAGDMMGIFGQRAGPAMAALVEQGSESLRSLVEELLNAGGTAQRIADVQMRGFRGMLRELWSAVEAAALAIAESGIREWATNLGKRLASLVRNLASTNAALLRKATVIGLVAAAIPPLLIGLGAMLLSLSMIAKTGAGAVLALQKLGRVFTVLSGALSVKVVLAIAAVGAVVWAIRNNWAGMGDVALRVWNAILSVVPRVLSVLDSAFRPWINLVIGGFRAIGQIAWIIFDEYVRGPAVRAFRAIRDWAEPVLSAVAKGFELLGRLGEGAAEAIRGAFADAAEESEGEGATLGSRIAAAVVESFGTDYVGAFVGVVSEAINKAKSLIANALATLRRLATTGAAVTDLENAAAALNGVGSALDGADEGADSASGKMHVLAESVENVASAFADALGGAISDAREAFSSFVEYALRELLALAARFLVFKAALSVIGAGPLGGLFGGSFLGFKLPGFASGGYLRPGEVGIVGERGPELVSGGPAGLTVTNAASTQAAMRPIIFDASRLPAPRDPLSAARDADWVRFITETLRQAESAGALALGTVG